MTLLLRKSRAQAKIEGLEPADWRDDDYAVVDDTVIGRILQGNDSRGTEVALVLAVHPGDNSGWADRAAKSGHGRYPRFSSAAARGGFLAMELNRRRASRAQSVRSVHKAKPVLSDRQGRKGVVMQMIIRRRGC